MAIEFLISYLTRKRRGDVARRDVQVEGEVVRLGRGADCQVYLPDPRMPLLHSEIRERDGDLFIEAAGATLDLKVNGTSVRSAKLQSDARIDIGPYELVVGGREGAGERRGEGRIGALSVELIRPLGDDFAELAGRSRTSIGRVGLSKRAWSWLLFLLVAVVGLGLPLVGTLDKPEQMATALPSGALPKTVGEAVMWAGKVDWLRTADELWVSGDISSAHRNFGGNCGACHEKPFVQVRDVACLRCHEKIEQHADPKEFRSASFDGVSCEHCHKEHNGPEPILLASQTFCVSCHGDLHARESTTTLQNVTDFGSGHPEFRPTIVVDPAGPVMARMMIGGNPPPIEKSNLKFRHDKHLDKAGVQHPAKGKIVLTCNDCHKLEPGGQGMLPIVMANVCQQCHLLQFDPTAPDRVLQHGKPREAVEVMREFYSKAALMGGAADPTAPAVVRDRRRPGVGLKPEESVVSLNWALQKAAEVATETIGKRACGNCHFVTPPGPDSDGIWDIAKPVLADRFMPKGRFDHGKHLQIACVDCHAAPESKSATDVLLPGIKTCQRCHGGEAAAEKVPSTCIMCHDFHIHGRPPMRVMAKESG